jgi:hypothetical protein
VLSRSCAIKKLFKSKTYEEFLVQYEEQKQSWDEAYISYFENNILLNIHSIGRWSLETLDCPFSGLTTNPGEGMNNLFKALLEYKEVPLDVAIVCYFRLSVYYDNEIKRG